MRLYPANASLSCQLNASVVVQIEQSLTCALETFGGVKNKEKLFLLLILDEATSCSLFGHFFFFFPEL